MLKFRYTKVGGLRTRPADASRVEALLLGIRRRPTWESLIVSPDAQPGPDGAGQYPILSLSFYPDYGYSVHCEELSPKSHFLASATALSRPSVYVELGGQGQELWPPELFVPLAAASKAFRCLLRTGARDPSLPWIAIDAFPRQKVKPRTPSAQAARARST